jgi:Holliday junction DNA helicase RuvA
MITFLNGELVEKHPTRVVVDVGGIGYEAHIPLSSYDRLPPRGERLRLLTYDHVREDVHLLFGFVTDGERQMFELLLGVTGIGPKLALSALSGLTVRELKACIVGADLKRLSSISGLGKKTAERIVLELRDRIGAGEALEALSGSEDASAEDLRSRDAIAALVSLGYKQEAARKLVLAVRGHDGGNLSVEELIKKALGQ